MKRTILTVAITLVVLLVIPLIILSSGIINMAATNSPGKLETTVATFAVKRSLAMHAPEKTNPFVDDPQTLSTGLDHYRSMCVRCHGAPGVKPEEFARGLNPPAPELDHAAKEMSDGELFWITKHGIRMTGMPAFGATHDDDDIWKIVAFVKQLPNLSDAQKKKLSNRGGEGHQHGGHGDVTEDKQHEH
tara:strand:- start:257 stop:823 length:567 start_codon:yes stop_codon:yes gene_type:complete